ncbi:MAG: LuxR C-terminal-related transcriptional regulator [Anaerolineales bacterium]
MIRVLLVNTIPLMANMVASVLEDESDLKIVGTVESAAAALKEVPYSDVVLVSTNLPNNQAFYLLRTLAQNEHTVKGLVMGLNESVTAILPYIEAGAFGYVLQNDSVETLVTKIRAAHRGEALISPRIASVLMSRVAKLANVFAQHTDVIDKSDVLTNREREILDLIQQGLSNREIADRLFIETGTVKNHVHNILQKLDVNSREEAAVYVAVVEANRQQVSVG